MTQEPTGAALATFRLVEAWRSLRFLQLFVFTVIALLLIPLQLRFRALWLVLSALYLNAVVDYLTAGRFRMRVRWALLATWVLALAETGQFYVAVVIAWLVSAYAARHRLGA